MIDREAPRSESNRKSDQPARAAKKDEGAQKKSQPAADGPPCPICGKSWDTHNLVRVRECMPKLDEALKLAERARIRASLSR